MPAAAKLVVTHTWNTAMPNNNIPIDGHIMIFEPKAPDNLARLPLFQRRRKSPPVRTRKEKAPARTGAFPP